MTECDTQYAYVRLFAKLGTSTRVLPACLHTGVYRMAVEFDDHRYEIQLQLLTMAYVADVVLGAWT